MSLSMEGILSYSDINLLSIKNSIEYGTPLYSIFADLKYFAPSEWDPLNPGAYWPRLCMTDFDTYKDISTANWPVSAINDIRDIKIVFKEGLTGEISSPVVTNWAIAANVATLTFQSDADHISLLTDLLEDETQHGSYTNYRSVTLPLAIGDISAGTYALTNINASTRQISFAFTAANNSGAAAAIVDFYAYRIAGSTTTARIFSARGLSLMGVNDANGYFVSGGLRRRGYLQGHWHEAWDAISGDSNSHARLSFANTGGTGIVSGTNTAVKDATDDGTNGPPRTAKETHSPAMAVHLYLHLGRYAA
jgi:hypothetical protein